MNQNKDATSWKHHEKKLSKITNEGLGISSKDSYKLINIKEIETVRIITI